MPETTKDSLQKLFMEILYTENENSKSYLGNKKDKPMFPVIF